MITDTHAVEWEIMPISSALTHTQTVAWAIAPSTPVGTLFGNTFPVVWAMLGQETIDLILVGAPTGLVGTLTFRLITSLGVDVYGPTTSGIAEIPVGAGRYVATVPLPAEAGEYFAVWSDGVTTVSESVIVRIGGFVESFPNRVPPAREDGIPWFEVTLQESPSRIGEWTDLDTFVLSPVDADPSNPLARGFTTGNATITDAFYRLVWADAAGGVHEGNPE